MADQTCRHCGDVIRRINYALGPEWMHVDPLASFPTTGKGSAWRACRATTVAEPTPEPAKHPAGHGWTPATGAMVIGI